MATEDEYRQFAEECMQWARAAESDAERKAFLDMARSWTQAASALTNGVGVRDALIHPSAPEPKVSH
jgi:hypothetical protein